MSRVHLRQEIHILRWSTEIPRVCWFCCHTTTAQYVRGRKDVNATRDTLKNKNGAANIEIVNDEVCSIVVFILHRPEDVKLHNGTHWKNGLFKDNGFLDFMFTLLSHYLLTTTKTNEYSIRLSG